MNLMKAMVLERQGDPLVCRQVPIPSPGEGQVLIQVHACGICRTDLHVTDGDLTSPKLPLIPGHQIIGTVCQKGGKVRRFRIGDRIGVPWLGWTCGTCRFCTSGRENLCRSARFTGYTIDGGFAEYAVADQRYCFTLPSDYPDSQAAPLLCAGLIGYRAYSMAADARVIGIYGFGSAAHIITQVAVFQGKRVYAFTRKNDREAQQFALRLGAVWSGASTEMPAEQLDAAILFAPAGELVPLALRATAPGAQVICAGIHMTDIPSFSYNMLWEERSIRSVANLTRTDGREFFAVAPRVPVRTTVNTYNLEDAQQALDDLRSGRFSGAAVLVL